MKITRSTTVWTWRQTIRSLFMAWAGNICMLWNFLFIKSVLMAWMSSNRLYQQKSTFETQSFASHCYKSFFILIYISLLYLFILHPFVMIKLGQRERMLGTKKLVQQFNYNLVALTFYWAQLDYQIAAIDLFYFHTLRSIKWITVYFVVRWNPSNGLNKNYLYYKKICIIEDHAYTLREWKVFRKLNLCFKK